MTFSDISAALAPVVQAFDRLGIAYHVGGSVASSAYGVARTTLDIDLVADIKPEHAQSLSRLLAPAYYIDADMILDAICHEACFNVIHQATMMKVDVFVLKKRAYDQVAFPRRRRDTVGVSVEVPCFLASPEDIILSKLEWFKLGQHVSERQWRDVLGVLRVQAGHLDLVYLTHWAGELGILDLFNKATAAADMHPRLFEPS